MITTNDTSKLVPQLQNALRKLQEQLAKSGVLLVITNTTRSIESQERLLAMGLSPYRGWQTWHHHGYAFTAVPVVDGVIAPSHSPIWLQVGAAAEAVGMTWGGRWHGKLKNTGYFEWHCPDSLEYMRRQKEGVSA